MNRAFIEDRQGVSIRFERGPLSHAPSDRHPDDAAEVSIRFERGPLSHYDTAVKGEFAVFGFNPL